MKTPTCLRIHRALWLASQCLLLWLPFSHGGNFAWAADASPPPSGAAPFHLRCVWTTAPDTSATFSWSTRESGSRHEVRLRVADELEKNKDENGNQIKADTIDSKATKPWTTVAAQRSGRFAADLPQIYYHHAHVEGLRPGTDYEVVFSSDARKSPTLTFRTAPRDDVPVSLLFGADSRSGLAERRQVNAMIARIASESYVADRSPVLAFAHGGDYVANGNQLDQWVQWLTDYELTINNGRLLPIIPARGNHDVGELFNQIFAFPEGDANYYSIDIGPQLHWITLNTETSVAGDQTTWLAAELATSRPHYRWVAAQYHRPAYAAVKLPFRALAYWSPLFEKFNVDLVCEGDGHCIKRTAPVRNNQIDPTGVVYIGEGGLGVGQRTPKTDRWYLREPHAKAGSGHHVQLLTFGPDVLQYRAILLGGEVFDDHLINARRQE